MIRQPHWDDIERERILNEKGRICVSCGDTRNLTVHHILPLSAGGTDDLKNLEVRCRRCHDIVHGIMPSGRQALRRGRNR